MDFENNFLICELFDLYGNMLTDNQQNIMKAYYYQNLSLGEIANNNNITRQAIYDTVKKAITTLENIESKLGLHKKYTEVKEVLKNQFNQDLENLILNILYK